jgi:hypothetical protein
VEVEVGVGGRGGRGADRPGGVVNSGCGQWAASAAAAPVGGGGIVGEEEDMGDAGSASAAGCAQRRPFFRPCYF